MLRKSVHFLLVEDDDDHAELIATGLLAENGIPKTVHRVRDGEAALAYLRRGAGNADHPRPNVVLLDLKLPRMGGHEVLAAIKSDASLRNIPVLVLTTSQTGEDKTRAYACHVNSYLAKPLDYGEFRQMIRDLCRYWCMWNQLSD
ncbi:MAG TPA: response regulator [Phycisphaerae bacterium]|nr:response regulator [Phycisphaerae bacterium]